MKIAIAGAGYVGFSLAVLLSQSETVSIVDPVQEKVDIINRGQSPIQDASVRSYIDRVHPSISASTDGVKVYADADYIIVAVPTDYDSIGKTLCTDIVESVLSQIDAVNSDAVVIIKSTLPIGFTRAANERHGKRVLYSPEFLRENQALQDHFEPDRIVIGYPPDNAKLEKAAKDFASLLSMNSHREDVPCLFTSPDEAEAIKLFSKTKRSGSNGLNW